MLKMALSFILGSDCHKQDIQKMQVSFVIPNMYQRLSVDSIAVCNQNPVKL